MEKSMLLHLFNLNEQMLAQFTRLVVYYAVKHEDFYGENVVQTDIIPKAFKRI